MAQRVFAGPACPTAMQATASLYAGLKHLDNVEGWKVVWAPGVTPTSCVSGTLNTVTNEIRLSQALGADLIAALDDIRAQLMSECLGADDAIALVSSTLEAHGVATPDVQTGGPVGGPLDELDLIQQHVADGCFIYSTVGYTSDGHRIFYVAGK